MEIAGPDFKLSSDAIQNLIKVYRQSQDEAIEALEVYKARVEEILGEGWQGAASEEFRNIIVRYEQETIEFIVEIAQAREFFETHISGSLNVLDSAGSKVAEQAKNILR